jgi:hypothetical protein
MKNPQAAEAARVEKEQGFKEVLRHAYVSLRNQHYCKECFTCACLDRAWYKIMIKKEKKP